MFNRGTNNQLFDDFTTYMLNLMEQEDIEDDIELQVDVKVVSGSLDIAYNESLSNHLKAHGIPVESIKMSPGRTDDLTRLVMGILTRKDVSEDGVFEYSDALFKLPNGRYGNANEAGNYAIGFAYGFSGCLVPPTGKAQLYSILTQRRLDEPNEQRLLSESWMLGLALRLTRSSR